MKDFAQIIVLQVRKKIIFKVIELFKKPNISAGWAPWEQWSNCPVTCGKGQVARHRKCQDDHKTENQRGLAYQISCNGKKIEKQTRVCDLGPCGSCGTCPIPITTPSPVSQNFQKHLSASKVKIAKLFF